MPWLLNEAAALKLKLSDLTVNDATAPESGRPVPVRFREPENELANMEYPSIILEYAGISRALDREHRGPTTLPYIPEGQTVPTILDGTEEVLWDTSEEYDVTRSPFKVQDHPVPYNVDFQITIYTRLQNHLMELIGKLAQLEYLPARFGYLEIPQDGTVRVLDLMGGPEIVAQRDGEGKRTFQGVYSVRVTSELNLGEVREISSRISTVDLQVSQIPLS